MLNIPENLPDQDATVPVSKSAGSTPRGGGLNLPLPEEMGALLPKGYYAVESFLGQGGMGAVYKGT